MLSAGAGAATRDVNSVRARPDLASMAIQPTDLGGRTKPVFQGYLHNPAEVGQYVRMYQGVSVGPTSLSSLRALVEMVRTTQEAKSFLARLHTLFTGPKRRETFSNELKASLPPNIAKLFRIRSVSPIQVSAGDQALAFAAKFTLVGHNYVAVDCVIRRGTVVESLWMIGTPDATIPRLATARLARIAEARIDQVSHK
jgi:hypothetical protein